MTGGYAQAIQSNTTYSTQPSGRHRHNVTVSGVAGYALGTHAHALTAAGTIGSTGGGKEVDILGPSYAMYMWERIS